MYPVRHTSNQQFVEVEEDDADIPLEELFAPQTPGEVAADEDGEVSKGGDCCSYAGASK